MKYFNHEAVLQAGLKPNQENAKLETNIANKISHSHSVSAVLLYCQFQQLTILTRAQRAFASQITTMKSIETFNIIRVRSPLKSSVEKCKF